MSQTTTPSAGSAVTTEIVRADGSRFRSFTDQPLIKEALAHYSMAESLLRHWCLMSDQFGDGTAPDWLTRLSNPDVCEVDEAAFRLNIAIQEEVSRRVEAALAEARGNAARSDKPRAETLAKMLADRLQRAAATQRRETFAVTEAALQEAGLQSPAKPAGRPKTPKKI